MMAVGLKGDERVILQWQAEGPLRKMYAECTRTGEVRGYLSDPSFEMTSTTPLGYAMRAGTFEVIHILYNNAKPYISAVDIAGADVISDWKHYYKQVEGMTTIIDLETIFEGDEIAFSGGLIIQPLPQPTLEESEAIMEKYKQKLKMMPPMRVLFKDDAQSLHQIIDTIAGYEVPSKHKSSTRLDFYCRCHRAEFQDFLKRMVTSNKHSLWDKDTEHENIETHCQYCSKEYSFTREELTE
jgi:molecular chaperone Hsp33